MLLEEEDWEKGEGVSIMVLFMGGDYSILIEIYRRKSLSMALDVRM